MAKQHSAFKLNYTQTCEAMKITPIDKISRVIVERIEKFQQYGEPIGDKGTAPLVAAIKAMEAKGAETPEFPPSTMLHIKEMTILKCDLRDGGAADIASILKNKFLIESCELRENDIG